LSDLDREPGDALFPLPRDLAPALARLDVDRPARAVCALAPRLARNARLPRLDRIWDRGCLAAPAARPARSRGLRAPLPVALRPPRVQRREAPGTFRALSQLPVDERAARSASRDPAGADGSAAAALELCRAR